LKSVPKELHFLNRTLRILGRAQAERLTCRRAERRPEDQASEQSRHSHESNSRPTHQTHHMSSRILTERAPKEPTPGPQHFFINFSGGTIEADCRLGVRCERRRVGQRSHRAIWKCRDHFTADAARRSANLGL